MHDLSPAFLMTPAEWREAVRLRRSFTAESKVRLSRLSAKVLRRALGLERYMVIRVEHEPRPSVSLQVLECSLSLDSPRSGGQWHVCGRNLRADGNLGASHAYAFFAAAFIYRRTLRGHWELLIPRKLRNTRRASASR